ncbi:hypothetical protein HY632_05080 [Candidatus Uhrbacteria bacterium]|nr:hypothetical protein [Candidatus Uhrbacteria bacterium]
MTHRLWWRLGMGVCAVLVFGFVVWQGVREEPAPEVTRGTTVAIVSPPTRVSTGALVAWTWDARAPVGASATRSGIVWGATPHPEAIAPTTTPEESGYPKMLTEESGGPIALPRRWTSAGTFPLPGTYYLRAFASIDTATYWSPEYTVIVE